MSAVDRWRERGRDGGRGEQAHAQHEHAPASEAVAERGTGEHQHREGQRVGVHGPLEVGEVGAEVRPDGWQRRGDHESVEGEDEERHRRDGEGPAETARRARDGHVAMNAGDDGVVHGATGRCRSGQRRGTWMSVHRIAIAGVGGFALAVLLTGVITPGYGVRREAISALAALDSPHAWVMIVGFTVGAVGLVAAGVALWRLVPARSARVGAAMVVAAGALIAVAGFAREDCSDQLSTCKDFGEAVHASGSYWLHSYVSLLAFLLLIVSSFLVARGLRRTGRRSLGNAGRVVGARLPRGPGAAGGHALVRGRQLRHRPAPVRGGALRVAGGRCGRLGFVVSYDTIPGLLSAAVDRDAGAHLAPHRRRHAELRRCGRPRGSHSSSASPTPAYAGATWSWSLPGPPRRTSSSGSHWPPSAPSRCPPIPTGTPDELAGLLTQVQPRAVVTDADLRAVVEPASAAAGAIVLDVADLLERLAHRAAGRRPARRGRDRPRRRRGADPDLGHHRPIEAGDADPARLLVGGRGVPVVDGAHGRGPDDDHVAAVPRQRAGLLRARVAGDRRRAGAGAAVLRERVPGLGRRHGATEFNAIGAMLEILMRQPVRPDDADTDLRLCYTGPSPAREWQEAFEERFGLRVVCGYAMSESPYGLIWRHGTRPFGTLGWPRQHPTAGHRQRGSGGRRGRSRPRPGRDRRAAAPQPDRDAGLLADAGGDRGRRRRRLAAHRRPRHGERRRHLHLRGPQEGGAPAARPEPVAPGGRGRDHRAPRRPRGGGGRRSRPS